MSIDADTARKIARLARIATPEEDLPNAARELSNILGWIERLREVDVKGVAPMTSVAPTIPGRREDAVTEGDIRDKVLANAPDAREGFFAVPKVVE